MKKRIVSVLLAVMLLMGSCFNIDSWQVSAASQADSIIDTAKKELGTKERTVDSDDIKYNDEYYGRRVSNQRRAQYAWCAVFVWWCARHAGIPDSIIPKTAGACDMKNKLIQRGGIPHLKGSGYKPIKGDIIFFTTDGVIHHVGIVDYTSGSTVYYIDGNNTQTTPHGVHNSSCSLSKSNFWGVVTPNYSASKPANPKIVKTQANSTSSITIEWEGVTNADSYRIDRRKAGNNTSYETIANVSSSNRSYKDSNLAAGTHYYYRVYAKNAAGYSEKQDGYSAYTLPSTPKIKKISTVSQAALAVTWEKVPGASSYLITRRKSGTNDYKEIKTVSGTSYTDTGLKSGSGYWYKICALNNGGKSAYSEGEYGMTTCVAPTVQTRDTSSLIIKWNEVVGKTPYEYILYRKKTGDSSFQKITTTTGLSYTDTGLISNENYIYKLVVVEVNTNIQVMSSNESTGKTASLPKAPVIKISNQDSNTIGISWEVVNYAKKYNVYRKSADESSYTLLASTASTSYIDKNVVSGVKYEYCVKSVNAVGTSSASNVASAYAVLPAPSNVACTAKSKTSIEVTWNTVKGADGYLIRRRKDGENDYKIIMQCTEADATSFIDTGLTAGTTYYYKIKTWTGNQTSAISDYAKATTLTGTVSAPEAPIVSIEVQSTSTLKLSWNQVAGAKKYEVYRRLAGEGYPTTPTYTTTAVSLTDNNLTPGTRYWYRVYAVNSSNEKSEKQPGMMCYTIPAQPVVTVQTVSMSSLKASWTTVKGAAYYILRIRKSGDETYETVTTTENTTYLVGDLEAGTTYYFRVYAVVSDRNSYDSYIVSEKPAGVGGTTKYNPATCSHSYGSWVVTQNATCTQSGSKYQICSKCENKNVQSIPATGHNYSDTWTIEKAATCENEGIKYQVCEICGDKENVTIIPPTGHTYSEWAVENNPSCITEGVQSRICSICGDKDTETMPMIEHSYEISEYKEPTTELQGYEEYLCSICGNTYRETIEVLPKEEDITVKLNSNNLELNDIGEQATLTASITPAGMTDFYLEWSSNNEEVAEVDEEGVVTAVSPGEAIITVMSEGGEYIDTCKVVVKSSQQVLTENGQESTVNKDSFAENKELNRVFIKSQSTSSGTTVTFYWNRVDNADGYQVYMFSSVTKKWILKKTLQGSNSTSYKDRKLKPGMNYKYKVRAFKYQNGIKEKGDFSEEISISTLPKKITIKKIKVTQNRVYISWKKIDCAGYVLQKYDFKKKTWKKVKNLKNTKEKYVLKTNKSNKKCRFRIAAYQKSMKGNVYGKWKIVTVDM